MQPVRHTSLGQLLVAIVLIAVALAVTLPAIPRVETLHAIDDPGPLNLLYYRVEFASAIDAEVLGAELQHVLPADADNEGWVGEILKDGRDGRVFYVGIWMLDSHDPRTTRGVFGQLRNRPIRVALSDPPETV